jgi:hypothetical protein
MIVAQKKENQSSLKKPLIPQYKRRSHGRTGFTCLFKGVGTFDLGTYQWTLRTIQLSDPVFYRHHTTHSGVPLPRGRYTACMLRQFRIDFD